MGSQIAGVPGLFAGAALANVVSGLIGQRWISRYVAERLPVQPA